MQMITTKKRDFVTVLPDFINDTSARFKGLGITAILLSIILSGSAKAGKLELALDANTTVGKINIEGHGKKEAEKGYLTAFGRMYIGIKKKKPQGFAPVCKDARKFIAKPNSKISKRKAQKVYFVALLDTDSNLFYTNLSDVTFHIGGGKKGKIEFSESNMNFFLRWKGRDGSKHVVGTTKNSNAWHIRSFFDDEYKVPIVLFCQNARCWGGIKNATKIEARDKVVNKFGIEKKEIGICPSSSDKPGDWDTFTKKNNSPKHDKVQRPKSVPKKLHLTGGNHLSGWQVTYSNERLFGQSCQWLKSAPSYPGERWKTIGNSGSAKLTGPENVNGKEKICLYLHRKNGSSSHEWSCVEKGYRNSSINIDWRDLEKGKTTCPWNRKKTISIKIVRKGNVELSEDEKKFLLPDGLKLKTQTISQRKLKISSSDWEKQKAFVEGAFKGHLNKFFKEVTTKLRGNVLTATVVTPKYIDLARLKVRFKYPGANKYSSQCKPSLTVSKYALVGHSRVQNIVLRRRGNLASKFYYEVQQTRKAFVWKRKGAITIKIRSSVGCLLEKSTTPPFQLKDIYANNALFAQITLKRRKPTLIVVLEPVNDQYFETSIKKDQEIKPWQSDLEQLWRRILGTRASGGMIGSIIDEDKWSDVLFIRRSGGDYGDENRWRFGKKADLINELVEDIPNSDNSLHYGKLIKQINNKSPSADMFVLIIGTPYKYKGPGAPRACDRFGGQGGPSDIKNQKNGAYVFELSFGTDAMLKNDDCRHPDSDACTKVIKSIPIDIRSTNIKTMLGKDNVLFKCASDKEKELPLLIAKIPRAGSMRYGPKAFEIIQNEIKQNIQAAFKAWESSRVK